MNLRLTPQSSKCHPGFKYFYTKGIETFLADTSCPFPAKQTTLRFKSYWKYILIWNTCFLRELPYTTGWVLKEIWESNFHITMQSLAVKVEDISFVGIKGTSATEEAIKFACSETFPCERLYLEDIQLVSYSGDSTRSFCWEAQGSCSGLVYPPPCFSYNDSSYIEQKVLSSSVLWSIWGWLYYSG